jgi:hypothetical protein
MLPPFTQEGFLPDGTHDADLEEIRERFGTFQASERRPTLFARLKAYVEEARSSGIVVALVIDGSFVTSKSEPNDIDLVVILHGDLDISSEFAPDAYNVLSRRRVRKRFGFDILLARAESDEVAQTMDFFRRLRGAPHLRKGIVRIAL